MIKLNTAAAGADDDDDDEEDEDEDDEDDVSAPSFSCWPCSVMSG